MILKVGDKIMYTLDLSDLSDLTDSDEPFFMFYCLKVEGVKENSPNNNSYKMFNKKSLIWPGYISQDHFVVNELKLISRKFQ